MTQVLRVEGAQKRFGTTLALNGADLTLDTGEWIALLGPNGAGKTTLIRAIMARVRLDAGSVSVFDQPVSPGNRAGLAKVGLVPQEIAVYPTLTARENLEVFGRLSGVSSDLLAERVRWALDFTRLTDRADDRAGTFSGGMKRRLNIACGLLHRPQIVLLDEPTVGVDPQSRHLIWEMLRSLKQQGVALLLTTHQLDEAQQVADRIVIIDHGRVAAEGTLHDLIQQTVGSARRVVIRLDSPLPSGAAVAKASLENGEVVARMENVGIELPELLRSINAAGAGVADVRVEAPSLQGVFLHLTGHELRDTHGPGAAA